MKDLILVGANIARRNKDNEFTETNSFTGEFLFTQPHGTFYSTTTQAIANISNTQVIALENEEDKEKLTHSNSTNNNRIYIQDSGSYEIIFSGIADINASGNNKHIEIWLCIDGDDIADSNTIAEIVNPNVEMTVVASWITDLNAGQYICLKTWGDSTNCQWLATVAGTNPTRPACPSIIITVKRISSYP